MASLGFIGLGNMGRHMARHLLKAGRQLIVYDLDPEPMKEMKKMGAKLASAPAVLAEQCSEIITMLPTQVEVKEAFFCSNGIVDGALPGTLCIDCSTLPSSFEAEMAKTLAEKNLHYIDAPVSGGVVGAENGTLMFMVGGSKKSFDRASTILRHMGRNAIHCGQVGNGQATKICNNMLLCIQMLGVSEAMNLGIRLGLEPTVLTSVINQSTGKCFASEVNNPVPGVIPNAPASHDYEGGFKCHLAAKDLRLAQTAATETLSPIPLGAVTHQFYRLMANSSRYENLDFSAIYKFLQDVAS